jgi:hypothetical protein
LHTSSHFQNITSTIPKTSNLLKSIERRICP